MYTHTHTREITYNIYSENREIWKPYLTPYTTKTN